MTEIEYARDYGMSPASSLWIVWRGPGYEPARHASREKAEEDAARIAAQFPGCEVHILAVIATVSTSPKVVGTRFDPSRVAPEAVPEFDEVEPPAAPQVAEQEPI